MQKLSNHKSQILFINEKNSNFPITIYSKYEVKLTLIIMSSKKFHSWTIKHLSQIPNSLRKQKKITIFNSPQYSYELKLTLTTTFQNLNFSNLKEKSSIGTNIKVKIKTKKWWMRFLLLFLYSQRSQITFINEKKK